MYLPQEFSHVVLSTVYVPQRNMATEAAREFTEVIHDLQQAAPDAFMLINGDFNHRSLGKSSVRLYQHVTRSTRGQATLDLCYSNVEDAYTLSFPTA